MIGFLTYQSLFVWSTPIVVLMILLELFVSTQAHHNYYKRKDTLANIFLGLCYVIVDVISKGLGIILLSFFYQHGFHWMNWQTYPILYAILLFLCEDFSYWFMHLLDHRIRLLWSGHIHHHSSREFNFSVGIRSAVFEPAEKFFFFIPMAIIGFRPLDIVLMYLLCQTWGTFVHTRTIKKLGLLEYFFTTPSHHRAHHGRNILYLDKNYGMVLIIWDKIFGTFQPEVENEPVDFGLLKNIDYKNYFEIIFYELKQILKDVHQKVPFRIKLKYVFGPPGYSHDGKTKSSRQLQNELKGLVEGQK